MEHSYNDLNSNKKTKNIPEMERNIPTSTYTEKIVKNNYFSEKNIQSQVDKIQTEMENGRKWLKDC